MCSDQDWKIRKQGSLFLKEFLEPVLVKSPDSIKLQDRFHKDFFDEIAELAADVDILVRIEGIELMTKYLQILKVDQVEADYVPNICELISQCSDTLTDIRVRVRMAMLAGQIIDKLSNFLLATKHQTMFLEYFKLSAEDPDEDIRKGMAYNLPCFYFTFKGSDFQEYFEGIYSKLARDACPTIRKYIAAGLHESMGLVQSDESNAVFRSILKHLMNDEVKEIREVLVQNIDKLIVNFATDFDIKATLDAYQVMLREEKERSPIAGYDTTPSSKKEEKKKAYSAEPN